MRPPPCLSGSELVKSRPASLLDEATAYLSVDKNVKLRTVTGCSDDAVGCRTGRLGEYGQDLVKILAREVGVY